MVEFWVFVTFSCEILGIFLTLLFVVIFYSEGEFRDVFVLKVSGREIFLVEFCAFGGTILGCSSKMLYNSGFVLCHENAFIVIFWGFVVMFLSCFAFYGIYGVSMMKW